MAERLHIEERARAAWLSALQAGDEVLVYWPDEAQGRFDRIALADAESVTLGEHPGAGRRRFSRATGQLADGRTSSELRPIPQALRDQWDARRLAGQLWPRLQDATLDQLRRIEAILAEAAHEA